MKKVATDKILVGHIRRNNGITPLLVKGYEEQWRGALRLKQNEIVGVIWLINGCVVHALYKSSKETLEGNDALDLLSQWTNGSYFFEINALPPDRSIRDKYEGTLDRVNKAFQEQQANASNQVSVSNKTAALLNELKTSVPGLESISYIKGKNIFDTTISNPNKIEELKSTMNSYFDRENNGLKRLFLQQDNNSMLVMKNGIYAAIIAAKSTTDPEALFKAAEVIEKQISTLN